MRWDSVVPAAITLLEQDAAIADVVGDAIVHNFAGLSDTERKFRVPSIEVHVISDVEQEVFNPLLTQFDLFAHTTGDLITLERRVRHHLHHDVPVVIGGIGMWAQVEARRIIPGTGGEILGVALDIRLTAIRENYTRDEEQL